MRGQPYAALVTVNWVNDPTPGRNPMRVLRPTVLALLLGTVLAGCSSDTTSSDVSADPGGPIPDGSYAKTVTVAQAKAMGITDQRFLDQLGPDGKTTFVFKFQGDRWTEFVVEDVPEPGDGGTLVYDAKNDIAMTSASDGCPGCVYTYTWALAEDELTLTLVGHESTDTPADVVIVRFVTEGAFTRQIRRCPDGAVWAGDVPVEQCHPRRPGQGIDRRQNMRRHA